MTFLLKFDTMKKLDAFLAEFRAFGYSIVDLSDFDFLNHCTSIFKEVLGVEDLYNCHIKITNEEINDRRINVFREINKIPDWESKLFSSYKTYLEGLLGPDMAIQLKLNPSIQMPSDQNSILEMHSDSLSGQSYFEVVCWTPITHAESTNSMFIFDRYISGEIIRDMPEFESQGMTHLFRKYASHAKFLKMSPGQGLIFSSTLLHGNVLNDTSQTRMSVNCRFKNLFAPEFEQYESERKLGTFYKLFSLSPVTELALASKERAIEF